MTIALAIRTVIEIIAVLLLVYCVFHEKKFIAFEDKLLRCIAKKIYIRRRRKAIEKRRKEGKLLKAVPGNKSGVQQRAGRVA